MLVLERKRDERILIGPDITVMITEIASGGIVRLGITAPPGVKILREELAAPASRPARKHPIRGRHQ